MKRIKVIFELTNTGYSAYSVDYSAGTTGDNISELMTNMVYSLNTLFEYEGKDMIDIGDLDFELDLGAFFKHYRVINASFLAKRIGMNETLFSQYVNGKKKPSIKQVEKIKDGLNEVGRELSELNLV
jgi:transcriptional regulator with XRE-family HTH domain